MNSIGFCCTISLYEPPILGLTEFVGHGIVIFCFVVQTVSLSSYDFTHRINGWEESKLTNWLDTGCRLYELAL